LRCLNRQLTNYADSGGLSPAALTGIDGNAPENPGNTPFPALLKNHGKLLGFATGTDLPISFDLNLLHNEIFI
jgi:hypothetical protein